MLRARQKLGKYRIVRCLSKGPLAHVYQAFDTVHATRVALKIPLERGRDLEAVRDFVHEVRVAAKLDHPNILPIQNAEFIDDLFVIAMPLGEESLGARLERRMSRALALDYAGQALAAVAHAHEHKIIHCDLKPENYIIFPDKRLQLADFGFAKIRRHTLKASGSGTIDYIAPEQAMGRPKFQSDVFSLGLVLYRMFAGKLPEWPFQWPPVGYERLESRVQPELIELLKNAIRMDPAERYPDAIEMQAEFARIRSRPRRQKRRNGRRTGMASWRQLQWREFQREFRDVLDVRQECRHCEGPVSEVMQACPWCGVDNPAPGTARGFPSHCPRCERGVKLDWNYCAWCYGPGFEPETNRRYSDRRYNARCKSCRGELMPFMRYCPWCRTKTRRAWPLKGGGARCRTCGSGIARDYWNYCAWCREPVAAERNRGSRR